MTKAELRRQQHVQIYTLPGLKRNVTAQGLEDQLVEVRKLEENLRKTYKVMRLIFTADYVQRIVLELLKFPLQELCINTRKREFVVARQLLMYALKEYTSLSLKDIGARFIHRKKMFDHTTVIYACQTVKDLRDTDLQIKVLLDTLHIKILKEYEGKDLVTIKEVKNANSESIFSCIEFSTYQFPSLFEQAQSQHGRILEDAGHHTAGTVRTLPLRFPDVEDLGETGSTSPE